MSQTEVLDGLRRFTVILAGRGRHWLLPGPCPALPSTPPWPSPSLLAISSFPPYAAIGAILIPAPCPQPSLPSPRQPMSSAATSATVPTPLPLPPALCRCCCRCILATAAAAPTHTDTTAAKLPFFCASVAYASTTMDPQSDVPRAAALNSLNVVRTSSFPSRASCARWRGASGRPAG